MGWEWEPSMSEITTIGLDLAKHVFQVHGIDADIKRAVLLVEFERHARCWLLFARRGISGREPARVNWVLYAPLALPMLDHRGRTLPNHYVGLR